MYQFSLYRREKIGEFNILFDEHRIYYRYPEVLNAYYFHTTVLTGVEVSRVKTTARLLSG
jgi:hypothetical protein